MGARKPRKHSNAERQKGIARHGNYLKQKRLGKGLTQRELAERLGLTSPQSYAKRVERHFK